MKSRITTALVLMPIVIAALCTKQPFFLPVVLGIAAGQIAREVRQLAEIERWWSYVGCLAGLLFPVGVAAVASSFQAGAWTGLGLSLIGLIALVNPRARMWLPLWASAPLGLLLLKSVNGIDLAPSWVWEPALIALLPLWAGDTAGIFAGKAFGKHKLAPAISPNKTWEGAIANFAACVLAGLAFAPPLGLSLVFGLAVGAWCGVVGQVGDLLESRLKREAGVKDSGELLPGHGGMLDRLDSFLLASPVVLAALILMR